MIRLAATQLKSVLATRFDLVELTPDGDLKRVVWAPISLTRRYIEEKFAKAGADISAWLPCIGFWRTGLERRDEDYNDEVANVGAHSDNFNSIEGQHIEAMPVIESYTIDYFDKKVEAFEDVYRKWLRWTKEDCSLPVQVTSGSEILIDAKIPLMFGGANNTSDLEEQWTRGKLYRWSFRLQTYNWILPNDTVVGKIIQEIYLTMSYKGDDENLLIDGEVITE